MILYVMGDLFQSPAQVLVNTVNTVGVMGKGVAYEFRRLFPEMFEQYRELCERGQLRVGMLWLYKTPNKWILNFPTKKHWRNPSRIEYITAGLDFFVQNCDRMGIHSIAFPPLGCGNGQLDFKTQVRPQMELYLRKLPIEVFIYPSRDDQLPPEHEDPEKMREWLRSEPTSLPFSVVWGDLVRLLERQSDFRTITHHKVFRAQISKNPLGLQIMAGGSRQCIRYDAIMAFWQQLGIHGFSMRRIAPGINGKMSYMVPVFSHLPYVKPVKVAEEYDRLIQHPMSGLQVLPSAFGHSREHVQLPLFKPD